MSPLKLYKTQAAVEEVTKLDKFVASPFRQEIELQHVEHSAGFYTLRVRIRERSRFTIFDIDAVTAAKWGQGLLDWAALYKDSPAPPPPDLNQEDKSSAG